MCVVYVFTNKLFTYTRNSNNISFNQIHKSTDWNANTTQCHN